MDALLVSTTSRRFPHPLAQLSAAIVVIAVHTLMALWLLQPRQPSRLDEAVRTSLRWLPRPPQPSPLRPRQPAAATASPAPSVRGLPRQKPSQVLTAPAAQPASSPPALNLSIAEAAAGGTALSADTFAQQPFRRLNNDPAFQHAPRYFRLKPQMSPKQMIQGVASYLGFWPPGYEVDPCRLSQRDVNYFQNAVSERDRDALRSALLQESARCRR